MDSNHYQQQQRLIPHQAMGADRQQHHQNPYWSSSSSSVGYHQQNYPHHHPPPPQAPQQQQHWIHHDNHPHHHHPQMAMPPLSYRHYPSIPPYPAPTPQPDPHSYPPPPPRSYHMPPLPVRPPSSFPPPNQALGNPSWAQHQGWEYPERNISYNNEEDWAARARAWATAKSVMENHHAQSQVTPTGRIEEHSYAYYDQYQQAVGSSFIDTEKPSLPQSCNQQLVVPMRDLQKQENHLHESTSFRSGPSSYGTDGHICYSARDEALATGQNHMASPSQRSFGPNSSVYEQEVPSSYFSTTGYRRAVDRNGSLHVPLPLPISAVQEGYFHSPSMLPVHKVSVEQPPYTHYQQSTKILNNGSDQPLDFEPKSAYNNDQHPKVGGHAASAGDAGGMNHDATATSTHAWTPSAAPGVVSPQIPPGPSGTQFSLPVYPNPVFGRIPDPNFGSSLLPVSAPFCLGTGASLYPEAAFPGDTNGVFNLSERPKKAAVPNWLREEIIKKKAVITSTAPSHTTEDSFHSIGSEDADKPFRKADQDDRKSIDSSMSNEDEEVDEDGVEAARSAATNQEIKCILTEVLLKVTDRLFDEIATKVLSEDDPTVEGEESSVHENRKVSPSPAIVPTPKASAKVLVQSVPSNSKVDGVGENSKLSAPGGDILGLANYASGDDGDDNDETQSSVLLSSGLTIGVSQQQESSDKSSKTIQKVVEKGDAQDTEPCGSPVDMESDKNKTDSIGALQNHSARENVTDHTRKDAVPSPDNIYECEKAPRGVSGICEELISVDSGKVKESSSENANKHGPMDTVLGKEATNPESTLGNANFQKPIKEEVLVREVRSLSSTNRHPEKKGTVIKEFLKEVKAGIDKTIYENSDAGGPSVREERDKVKEKRDKSDNLKDRSQDRCVKQGANVKSDSRISSKDDTAKEDRKETTKDRRERTKENGEKRVNMDTDSRNSYKHDRIKDERGRNKEDNERKREQRDGKEDRSIRVAKDLVRYNSRGSSSSCSRGRNSKEHSLGGHCSVSSDEPSENSKRRKLQSNKHSSSPSPVRSRGRQVSRSPHTKHSQRRHSPYSSPVSRRRRSRSSTPVNHRRSAH